MRTANQFQPLAKEQRLEKTSQSLKTTQSKTK